MRTKKQLKPELSQFLGIDQALISKFESGSRKPDKRTSNQISRYFRKIMKR
jgi:transcriptional regulator with XRE-family HTH domain